MGNLFQTTRWTLIAAAGSGDERATAALAELCQAYWRPICAFIRRHGHSPDAAADLTQAFFVHVLEHRAIERADQSRGRFRSYLLTSVHNFLSSARQHDLTQRRGANARHESIETIDAEQSPLLNALDLESSPDRVFERHWALNLTERALKRVRVDYAARGQENLFNRLRPLLTSGVPEPSSAGATDDRRNHTDAAQRTALHRARRRFAEALRAEILDTVADNNQVDEELRFLLRVLAG
jgi:RNA polymerase sigma factor (sigma-70 family)